ncbi:Uncharacterized protein BP5553_06830 [Venustampulla echinocandica]|uniref:Uncharacterized protein n=1 Tax=Venustampulla echinocandica TaxID=2656787 RepID=A0A370TL14_9HELO|nr:Uncharacterized protein BP5553_06830 [Venustampulla echinocandica]RDL36218.1 Uncharacterized protein BP5553_06830 [Venustampulla echinocandica]
MPPKRKAPLAAADANALAPPPAAKKTMTGKKMAQAGASAPAAAPKKYKYSDPSSLPNRDPVEIGFIMWEPREEDDEDDTDEGEEEEEVISGSLQDILDGLENERTKASNEALNPPHEVAQGARLLSSGEIRSRVDEASAPYREKMDEARQKFVTAGTMTAEEAKLIVGYNDEMKKERRKAKKDLQNGLNGVQKEKNKAIHLALDHDAADTLTVEEEQRRITEASKPFEEKMDKIRGVFEQHRRLTAAETKAIVPNIGDDAGDDGKNGDGKTDKDAEKEAFVPPRVATDKGFPITKAGIERFYEINEEVNKRDPDMHNMYIYNDFSGYGVIEVLENMLAEFNKLIFKKDVSPFKKWALVEGLATYLGMCDHMTLMMNENSEGMHEIFDMMGVIFITALEMLHESALIGSTSPLPDNVGVMTLFFLDFMMNTAADLDIEWVHEIVRSADMYCVVLDPLLERIEDVDQDALDDLRERCEEKRGRGFAWKTEYPKFKREHPGGDQYDITKIPKMQKARHTFGTKENDALMRRIMGEDSGEDEDSDEMGEWEDMEDSDQD